MRSHYCYTALWSLIFRCLGIVVRNTVIIGELVTCNRMSEVCEDSYIMSSNVCNLVGLVC
jgi:hypothetical protein